jgi:hypothetical protein
MSRLFCGNAIKLAANAAGVAVAIYEPELVKSVLPVVVAFQAKIDGGSDNAVLNSLLQQGITELLPAVKDNPVVMIEANALLTAINFDAVTGKLPVLSNADVKAVIDNFVIGMQAGTK